MHANCSRKTDPFLIRQVPPSGSEASPSLESLSGRIAKELNRAKGGVTLHWNQKARIRSTTYERLGGILDTLRDRLPAQAKAMTKRTVAEYIETRSGTDEKKPATVAKEISVLKHCLRLAVEWGELNQNAATGARLPKLPQGKTRYLTPGELKAALQSAPDWLRAPMAFAACTGVRRGEMLSLRWMDVDMKNRRLYLRETKNGTLRILPIPEAALTVLRSLPEGKGGESVFAAVDPAQLSVYTKRVFKRLGIPDASFHTLRHTAASWLVMEGVDLYAVGQILGHKTPRMTQRYAHLSPDYLAGAVGKLDGIMGGMLLFHPLPNLGRCGQARFSE